MFIYMHFIDMNEIVQTLDQSVMLKIEKIIRAIKALAKAVKNFRQPKL